MRKLYLLTAFLVATVATAQIINFPDPVFKAKLLAPSTSSNGVQIFLGQNNGILDSNFDGEIQVNEALAVQSIIFSDGDGISNLTGLEFFINLENLIIDSSTVVSTDLTSNTNLQTVRMNNCALLNGVNISGCSHLVELRFQNNPNFVTIDFQSSESQQTLDTLILTSLAIATLNVSNFSTLTNLSITNCAMLSYLDVSGTDLYNLSASGCSSLQNLDLSHTNCEVMYGENMTALQTINIKNGLATVYHLTNCSNIQYMCLDEGLDIVPAAQYVINSYCSFSLGGPFYTIQGITKFDFDNNGCTVDDLNFQHLNFSISDGTNSGVFIADNSGNYNIPVQSGTHFVTPHLENASYFNILPESISVTFPETSSPYNQNFCVTANGIHNDLEITLIPTTIARPGYNCNYKIVYVNKGNQVANGVINLNFVDSKMNIVNASPLNNASALNTLSWSFSDLVPFETRTIDLIFNLNSTTETPSVNNGDILTFATAIVAADDETPNDNVFALNQTVVNAFDPNDKICLEGTAISTSQVGNYVHYLIRFENTGSAEAMNVVVKDLIDLNKFDISTLAPIDGSHNYYTKIKGNKVEFIFENINLPFQGANNNGYVLFKIKTKPTLIAGNSFSNSASIYFDYNAPILTEPATTIISLLAVENFDFNEYFSIYPNPVVSDLNIYKKSNIKTSKISIYNDLGQLLIAIPNAELISKVDVSSLNTGNYFIKINSDKGATNARFVKI